MCVRDDEPAGRPLVHDVTCEGGQGPCELCEWDRCAADAEMDERMPWASANGNRTDAETEILQLLKSRNEQDWARIHQALKDAETCKERRSQVCECFPCRVDRWMRLKSQILGAYMEGFMTAPGIAAYIAKKYMQHVDVAQVARLLGIWFDVR